MLKRISVLALVLITALAVACGGSDSKGGALSGGGSSPNTTDPKAFTTQYYTTIFAAVAGSKNAQDLANFYAPSCRDNIKMADITRGIQDEQNEVSKIKGAKIDNVDFGDKFKSTKKDNGFTVNVPASKDSKIHVDGKWLNAHDYLVQVGFETADAGTSTEDVDLTAADNRLYVSDCDSLQSIAKAETAPTATPRSGSSTPTPRSGNVTPTPTPNTGRTTPTPVGPSGNLSTGDATTYARSYFTTILGALAGTRTAQDVINVYAPECQKQVKVADVTKGITTEAKNYPKLAGAKIDDFDFGTNGVTVKKGPTGFTVTVPSSKDSKVKVAGSTQNLHAYLLSVGLEDATDGDDTTDITVVVVSGKAYNGDCDELNAIAGN